MRLAQQGRGFRCGRPAFAMIRKTRLGQARAGDDEGENQHGDGDQSVDRLDRSLRAARAAVVDGLKNTVPPMMGPMKTPSALKDCARFSRRDAFSGLPSTLTYDSAVDR